ncbi:NACHT domain-containing protein [Actinokineospora guangxiensis]|uniref:NACHT domain-containing protein n=1 Tax=Actinokineospora guangxiensis TaxID=1490288 RepID=A0ABW0EVG7_9PSEU
MARRVFLSYAQEPGHNEAVWDLYVFLRRNGVDARLDIADAGVRQDWSLWMADQIREAEVVLCIASDLYRIRAEGRSGPDAGRGVQWEARRIRDAYYAAQDNHQRFVPVVLPGQSAAGVPDFLAPAITNVYVVQDFTVSGAEELLRFLLHRPSVDDVPIGEPPSLEVRTPGANVSSEQGPSPPRRGTPSVRKIGGVADTQLDAAASTLALEVRTRWEIEEENRQAQDPLPVRWRISDKNSDLFPQTGSIDNFADLHLSCPNRRFVVLGKPGAGKTVLALRFVLDMLSPHLDDRPVPVVFSVGSWDPTVPLRRWLVSELLRDHRLHSPDGIHRTLLARSLVQSGRVLPVLDGFDEIAPGRRRTALNQLGRTTLTWVLTSRPHEFTKALNTTTTTLNATMVTLEDLPFSDVQTYLPTTTATPQRWTAVLSTAPSRLQQALATPLMVSLAREIYSASPTRDPDRLTDITRFPDKDAIECHLLDAIITTAYGEGTTARHRLVKLAQHLHRSHTHNFAWWTLGAPLRLWQRASVITLLMTLTCPIISLLIEGPILGFSHFTFDAFLVYGLALGGILGSAHAVVASRFHWVLEPTQFQFKLRTTKPLERKRLTYGFLVGAATGTAFVLYMHLFGTRRSDLPAIAFDAVIMGTGLGVGAALAFGALSHFETPLDLKQAGTPDDLLAANRRAVIVQVLISGTVFLAIPPLLIWALTVLLSKSPLTPWFDLSPHHEPLFGLLVGAVGSTTAAVGYAICFTAWGQWIVFGRILLPLTGTLPWSLRTFLNEACEREVLRRSGPYYQFRHSRLQEFLASKPEDRLPTTTHRSTQSPGAFNTACEETS